MINISHHHIGSQNIIDTSHHYTRIQTLIDISHFIISICRDLCQCCNNCNFKFELFKRFKFEFQILSGVFKETTNFAKRDPNPIKQNRYLNGWIALNVVVKSDFEFGKVKP